VRIYVTALTVLGACVFLAGGVEAASPVAQLSNVEGKVYVNKGNGFTPVKGTVELSKGDRIMVGEKGAASIGYYLAGCDVMLTSSSMTTISEKAPCKVGSTLSTQGLVAGVGGIGIGPLVPAVGVATMVGLGTSVATSSDKKNDDNGQSP
jgi:hypothetical protein